MYLHGCIMHLEIHCAVVYLLKSYIASFSNWFYWAGKNTSERLKVITDVGSLWGRGNHAGEGVENGSAKSQFVAFISTAGTNTQLHFAVYRSEFYRHCLHTEIEQIRKVAQYPAAKSSQLNFLTLNKCNLRLIQRFNNSRTVWENHVVNQSSQN